jgi:hypothetical protein
MGTALNQTTVLKNSGNTGVGGYYLNPKNIVGAIILQPGTQFSGADIATSASFKAKLQTLTLAPKATRIYPVHDFQEIKQSSEALTVKTFGYGGKAPVREGYYDWSFQYIKGGLQLSIALREFNGLNVDIIFIDSEGLAIGWNNGGVFQGINQSFIYSEPWQPNDGSNPSVYIQRFVFKPQFLDQIGTIKLDAADFDAIQGLQNVVLTSGGARVTNVSHIVANFAFGAEAGGDVYDLYSTELTTVGNWVALDAVSLLPVAITSVTADPATRGFTGTLDTGDSNYNASHAVVWSFAPASTLNTNGIIGVESGTFQTPN